MISLKLNNADLSPPLIVEGWYAAAINAATLEESKSSPGAYNLKVEFALQEEVKTNKEDNLAPGYKLTRFFPVPRGDKNDEMFTNALTRLCLACFDQAPTKDNIAALPDLDEALIGSFPGRLVKVHIRTSKPKEGDEYGPKSEVSAVKGISQ